VVLTRLDKAGHSTDHAGQSWAHYRPGWTQAEQQTGHLTDQAGHRLITPLLAASRRLRDDLSTRWWLGLRRRRRRYKCTTSSNKCTLGLRRKFATTVASWEIAGNFRQNFSGNFWKIAAFRTLSRRRKLPETWKCFRKWKRKYQQQQTVRHTACICIIHGKCHINSTYWFHTISYVRYAYGCHMALLLG